MVYLFFVGFVITSYFLGFGYGFGFGTCIYIMDENGLSKKF